MKLWTNIFRVILLIIGIIVLSFNVLLYNSFEQQKMAMDILSKQQQTDSQVNSNKFKNQQDQIEGLSRDLTDARQQVKNQNDDLTGQKEALLQEIDKRQQVEDENKGIQTSLVVIKAQTDAIKQEMKGWQKDYVSVLAELSKKMDDSQNEIKVLEDNLVALNIPELKESIKSLKTTIEKLNQPTDNSLSSVPSDQPENKVEQSEVNANSN